jgi:hypothetical protein
MPWHKNDHILVGNIDMRYSKNLVSFVAVDLRKHGAIEVFARVWKNKIALQKDESRSFSLLNIAMYIFTYR